MQLIFPFFVSIVCFRFICLFEELELCSLGCEPSKIEVKNDTEGNNLYELECNNEVLLLLEFWKSIDRT